MMKIPTHVIHNSKVENARQWKAKKRREARELKRALNVFRHGCAYLPSGGVGRYGASRDVDIINDAIDRIIDDLSVKNWGR